MTTGKTKALTRRTFVDKVMSLLFNMLSRLVIAFLPRSKHLLISWLQSCLIYIKLYFLSGSLQMPEMLCPFTWLILTDPSGPRLNLFIHQENFFDTWDQVIIWERICFISVSSTRLQAPWRWGSHLACSPQYLWSAKFEWRCLICIWERKITSPSTFGGLLKVFSV